MQVNMDQNRVQPAETLEYSIDWVQSTHFEIINKVF